jgi:hypothetical protein
LKTLSTDLYIWHNGADKAATIYLKANMHWEAERCLAQIPEPSSSRDQENHVKLLLLARTSYVNHLDYSSEYQEYKARQFAESIKSYVATLPDPQTVMTEITNAFIDANDPEGIFPIYVSVLEKSQKKRDISKEDPILQNILDALIKKESFQIPRYSFFAEDSQIPFPVVFGYAEKLKDCGHLDKAQTILIRCQTALMKSSPTTNPDLLHAYPDLPDILSAHQEKKEYTNNFLGNSAKQRAFSQAASQIAEHKKNLIHCALHCHKTGLQEEASQLLKHVSDSTPQDTKENSKGENILDMKALGLSPTICPVSEQKRLNEKRTAISTIQTKLLGLDKQLASAEKKQLPYLQECITKEQSDIVNLQKECGDIERSLQKQNIDYNIERLQTFSRLSQAYQNIRDPLNAEKYFSFSKQIWEHFCLPKTVPSYPGPTKTVTIIDEYSDLDRFFQAFKNSVFKIAGFEDAIQILSSVSQKSYEHQYLYASYALTRIRSSSPEEAKDLLQKLKALETKTPRLPEGILQAVEDEITSEGKKHSSMIDEMLNRPPVLPANDPGSVMYQEASQNWNAQLLGN